MALSKYPVVTVSGVVRSVEPLANKTTGEQFASRLHIQTASGGVIRLTAYVELLDGSEAASLVGATIEATAQVGVRSFRRQDGTQGASLEVELSESIRQAVAA